MYCATDALPIRRLSAHSVARLLVTGANGHLGRRLINTLADEHEVEALVRSDAARRSLLLHVGKQRRLNVSVADPSDAAAVAEVGSRCVRAFHLIGTIKETRANRYTDAHERPAQALVDAAPRTALEHIVYVSIVGADGDSSSQCLRARAAVENILMSAKPVATIIRVAMVLGEKDRASFALAKRASARRVVLFRASSLEQPIYAGDVVNALRYTLKIDASDHRVFDLAGPESLSRRDLVTRAGVVLNNKPSIYSLPLIVGMGLAGLFELIRPEPPLTRNMLQVLDHDDAIDPAPAAAALGITLTPLNETLRRCIGDRLP